MTTECKIEELEARVATLEKMLQQWIKVGDCSTAYLGAYWSELRGDRNFLSELRDREN